MLNLKIWIVIGIGSFLQSFFIMLFFAGLHFSLVALFYLATLFWTVMISYHIKMEEVLNDIRKVEKYKEELIKKVRGYKV